MTIDVILRAHGLKKYYGEGEKEVRVLDGIDLVIERGRFTAIVGNSGSGKTTLLNMLGGLDTPNEGCIYVGGTKLSRLDEEELTIFRRKRIGFVFQNFNLISLLSVWENIIFPISLDGRKPDRIFVMEIVRLLGLEEKLACFPDQLSGGQQQRVAIGRALITRPRLILADEPTGNLDSRNSRDVIALLTSASRRYRQTILMITHNRNLTASVDRVFQVSDGILTDLGGTADEALS